MLLYDGCGFQLYCKAAILYFFYNIFLASFNMPFYLNEPKATKVPCAVYLFGINSK